MIIIDVSSPINRYPDGNYKLAFKHGGTEFVVYSNIEMNLIDGKTRKAMCGRGGGYCYYCDITIDAYHTPAGVRVEVKWRIEGISESYMMNLFIFF